LTAGSGKPDSVADLLRDTSTVTAVPTAAPTYVPAAPAPAPQPRPKTPEYVPSLAELEAAAKANRRRAVEAAVNPAEVDPNQPSIGRDKGGGDTIARYDAELARGEKPDRLAQWGKNLEAIPVGVADTFNRGVEQQREMMGRDAPWLTERIPAALNTGLGVTAKSAIAAGSMTPPGAIAAGLMTHPAVDESVVQPTFGRAHGALAEATTPEIADAAMVAVPALVGAAVMRGRGGGAPVASEGPPTGGVVERVGRQPTATLGESGALGASNLAGRSFVSGSEPRLAPSASMAPESINATARFANDPAFSDASFRPTGAVSQTTVADGVAPSFGSGGASSAKAVLRARGPVDMVPPGGAKPPAPPAGDAAPLPMPPDAAAAVNGVMARIAYGPEKTSWVQRVRAGWNALADAQGPMRRAEIKARGKLDPDGPTKALDFAQGRSSRDALLLLETGEIMGEKVLSNPLIAAVEKAGGRVKEIDAYAMAKRDLTRYQNKGIEGPFNPADARKTVEFFEKNHPEIVEAATAIHDARRALLRAFAKEAGWTPERLALVEGMNEWSVPMKRRVGASETTSGSGKTTLSARVLKKVKGGGSPVVESALAQMFPEARSTLASIHRQRANNALVKAVESNPEGWKGSFEIVKAGDDANTWSKMWDDAVESVNKEYDAPNSPPNKMLDPARFAEYQTSFLEKSRQQAVPYDHGGTVKFIRFKNPEVAKMYASGELEIANPFVKMAGTATRIFKAGTTGLNPAFGLLFNPARDAAVYLLRNSQPTTPVGQGKAALNVVRGVGASIADTAGAGLGRARGVITGNTSAAWAKTKIGQAYEALGAEGFTSVDREYGHSAMSRLTHGGGVRGAVRAMRENPGKALSDMTRDAIHGSADAMRGVVSIAESGIRSAEMLNFLEARGWKPGQPIPKELFVRAANHAAEITTNFKLGGRAVKTADNFLPFLNAATQGVRAVGTEMATHPGRLTARTMIYGVGPAVGLWALWHKDEAHRKHYEAMPAWRKAGWFNVPTGTNDDGTISVISWPKPQGFGAPVTAVEAALEAFADHNPDGAREMALDALKDFDPSGVSSKGPVALMGIASGAAEVAMDKNALTGQSINPRGLAGARDVAPWEVAHEYNGEISRWMSKRLHAMGVNMTTAEIEHLIGSQFGSMGRQFARADTIGEAESADTPIIGKFSPRIRESRWVSEFYDLKKKVEGSGSVARSLSKSETRFGEAEPYAVNPRVTTHLNRIEKAMGDLMDGYATADEPKRRAIMADVNALAQDGIELLRDNAPEAVK
jgi:hypothetical protein